MPATNPDNSDVRLLRAYLDGVTLGDALRTRIWHAKVFATLTAEGRRLVSAIPFLEGTPIRTAVDRMTAADRERIAAAMREFNAAVMQVEEE